ncbi:hypothetical protein P8452_30776 [Trifolium repens]|nr:hypothetical protein P8452_30776 [Trifolium repens]
MTIILELVMCVFLKCSRSVEGIKLSVEDRTTSVPNARESRELSYVFTILIFETYRKQLRLIIKGKTIILTFFELPVEGKC